MEREIYLGLGTNLGNKVENLKNAIDALSNKCGQLIKVSSVYESEPWGFESDSCFYNMVVLIKSKLSPFELLSKCQQIETSLGRKKKTSEGYQSRLIDIDILLMDGIIKNDIKLTIPHKFLKERLFVLEPLRELMERSKFKYDKHLERIKTVESIKKIGFTELLF